MATLLPRRVPTALSLPLRPKPSTSSCQPLNAHLKSQSRTVASFRRHRKLLNLPPATHQGGAPPSTYPSTTSSSATQTPLPLPRGGTSSRSHQPKSELGKALLAAGDRIVYAPPSSTPTPYNTPLKFLPLDDPRRATLLKIQQMHPSYSASSPATRGSGGEVLPKPLSMPYQKSYHLTSEDIEEIRRLRKSDENKWTRARLAEKFNCSQLFVGLVVQASAERLKQLKLEKRARIESWGPKRRQARLDRQKRRELWARDE